MRRRGFLLGTSAAVVGGLAGCSEPSEQTQLSVSSPPIESDGALPVRFTCDGAGNSPPFVVESVPEPTAGLGVVAEYDRGGILEPVFWTLWNVPPSTERIPAGLPRVGTIDSLGGARQGRPDGGTVGYEPPCPPAGQTDTHRFQVYALDSQLAAEAGTDHETATESIGNAVLASTRFTADYERPAQP